MFKSTKVQQCIDFMSRRGYSAAEVLDGSGLQRVEHGEDWPTLNTAQSQLLIRNMLELTRNQALGLEMGLEISPADMGVMGQGMIAAPTFRQCIELWIAHAPNQTGSFIGIDLVEDAELWQMHIALDLPLGASYRFCLEEYLALTTNLGRQLMGSEPVYSGIDIVYPAPGHAERYRQLLNCPVRFESTRNCISVLRPRLDEAILTRNDQLYPIYQHYCQRMDNQYLNEDSAAYAVYNYLLKNLGSSPSIEGMAAESRCSSSTLRRKLKQEGYSFRALHNEFRQDFAEEYLKSTSLSAKQVAYLLGYTDTKPFLRVFKSWTGMTVGEYKRQFVKL